MMRREQHAGDGQCTWEDAPAHKKQARAAEAAEALRQAVEAAVEDKCRPLCDNSAQQRQALAAAAAQLREALPLLPLPAGGPALLLARGAAPRVRRSLARCRR